MKRIVLAVIFFAILLGLWQAAFQSKRWSPVLLPSPVQVGSYLVNGITDGSLIKASGITMRRLIAGYLIGLIAGLPLGLVTARWRVLRDTIGTMALGLQTLP